MNIKHYILILLTACGSVTASAQAKATLDYDPSKDEAKASPTNLAKAKFQINDIKNRGIIVRLKTNKDRIEAYRKEGYKKVADDLEERSKYTNLVLTYAFIANWSYSPVYFMESQHTSTLLLHDTLIAKTYDLLRDTAIYINHDSIYLVDYGQLLDNVGEDGKSSQQSGTPVAGGSYLVIKDHAQAQLQSPLPFKAQVWGDRLNARDTIRVIAIPDVLSDSISIYLNRYKNTEELLHSDARSTLSNYMHMIFMHVSLEYQDKSKPETKVWGNPYTQGVLRFNEHFIEYYCKALMKDKGISCNPDLLYWWLRNPNIKYLAILSRLERELNSHSDRSPKFTAPH